ncbi:hypothetical protein CFC21_077478 [Triticum aestivum]|uniref:DUF632 domain-containing protein n=3 Tax=Triticinae TaxID=1648030 RepID=A0A453KQD6_AEGTS|nr:protein ROLLING AND ERECT LEAF 2-like [Aegilops tauschii subsp. strangulata]XP_040246255.1 protein ROLLING AND ERECT LEAF 2-like [Aegilops tauschii subsp. strangulata]XP_044401238.1 protein ROLLING AND ERECT LEAF 2-like [Triticum aestivum]KAF7072332.1 hypothetical protein CFC21_077478 [Triticum aestivum]
MGTTASKQDCSTALQLCKGRLKHIEQAIDARYALSAAHLSYEQSLRNVGVALRQFVESQHEGDPEKSPCSSSALPSPLPPADNSKISPLKVPRHSDISRLRSEVSPSLTVTVDPSGGDASFIRKGQPIPTSVSPPLSPEFCPPWDFFEPNDMSENVATHVSENCEATLDDFGHVDGRDQASSSQISEVQEQFGTHGCKDLDDNFDHLKLNRNDCSEIEIVDTDLPNDSSLHKGPDQVQRQNVEGQNPTRITDNRKNEAHSVDKVNVPKISTEREEEKGSSITSVSKDFLSDVKELERQFARAAESCHGVSRMLETRKIRLSFSTKITGKPSCALSLSASLLCCNAGNVASHESEQHVTKVIAWNRSLSSRSSSSKNPLFSAQKDDDPPESISDFVEEFCMISGSHASSLDRLYAWEIKIYHELKNIESIEQIYDKKCAQLSHLCARDADARQVDKTRFTIKGLYSRLVVGTEVLYSISKTIEKLRDEELQPQLLELLQGQTRMWRVLEEVHQMQQKITSPTDAKLPAMSPPSESRGHALMNLITELGVFYSSLAGWVDGYKNYVSGLHSWLQNCVVQPRDPSGGGNLTLSPRQHLAPPLFVLLGDLSAGMSSLPSEESCDSIKNLAADLKKMYRRQAAEQKKAAKKRSSDTGAEGDKSSETEPEMATLQGGLTAMFDRLSKLSGAMASLAENVKREAEIAREAYAIGRRTE